MKIALTAQSKSEDSPMDERFGRAPVFALADTETEEIEMMDNPAVRAGSGAGIQSAQILSQNEVEAVVSKNVGPKAAQALNAAGIDIYSPQFSTVKDNLEAFSNGDLKKIDSPTVNSHWGSRGGGRRGRRW